MSVVLHVGAHKTGTSLIQKYFRDRPEQLDPGAVAAIDRSDTNGLIGWGGVVVDRPRLLRRRLDEELQDDPSVVLVSHENSLGRPFVPGVAGLYPKAGELAAALARATEGLDVSVVLYVRPVADFVESYYLQTIHQGAWHSFDEWFDGVDATALSWMPVVEALESAFGADRTLIGDFQEIGRGQNEFLRLFMNRVGIRSPATVHYRPRRNASISSVGLDIALNVNPYLETRAQRVATRKFLQEHFSNAGGDRARPMPTDTLHRLEHLFADEYEQLAARTGARVGEGDLRHVLER